MSTHKRSWWVFAITAGLLSGGSAVMGLEENKRSAGGEIDPNLMQRMMARPVMPGDVRRILKDLSLDETQSAQAEEVMTELMSQYRERLSGLQQREEVREKMEEMRAEMQRAREQRDMDLIHKLRTEMNELMLEQHRAREQMESDLHDRIIVLLRPDQAEKFETAWKETKDQSARRTDRGMRSWRHLHRIVVSLDLSEEQRKTVDGVFKDYADRQRQKSDAKESKEDLAELRTKIEAHLTVSQKEMLEERLGMSMGPERMPRGPRPPREGEKPTKPVDEPNDQ
jgi:hypothetical protein